MNALLTTGQIAEKLNRPLWKIQYLINSRNLESECRAGHLRMYSPEILPVLRSELKKNKSRRKRHRPDPTQQLASRLKSAIGLITEQGGKLIEVTS